MNEWYEDPGVPRTTRVEEAIFNGIDMAYGVVDKSREFGETVRAAVRLFHRPGDSVLRTGADVGLDLMGAGAELARRAGSKTVRTVKDEVKARLSFMDDVIDVDF